jgi:multiple sugar transport system ATP-binding protein
VSPNQGVQALATVQYVEASRIYDGQGPAVDRLNLDIPDGEFMVLVGPSGSDKSTALRMLAGLEQVDGGEVRIGGANVTRVPPKDRDIAMVFQNYALYPHLSVADNMGFALKLKGISKADRAERVLRAAKLLDLDGYLDRKPKALSGGQRQRVAMGRAIVREPRVFLMDEPLSNLDAKLRVETRANIAGLQARLGTTTIYVTHDQVEAMTMGQRVAVLRGGKLVQVGTPRSLYEQPANSFVAGFIGSPAMNLRKVDIVEGGVVLAGYLVLLPRQVLSAASKAGLTQVLLGVRPEAFDPSPHDCERIDLQVHLLEELGADAYLYSALPDDVAGDRPFVVRVDGRLSARIGDRLSFAIRPGETHVFHPETGARLA